MKYRLLSVVILFWAMLAPVAAQTDHVLLDQPVGVYRVVATLHPYPASVGPATVRVAVTDLASGAPAPISAVNVIINAQSVGRDQLYVSPPLNEDRSTGVFQTERLYFAISDEWRIRVQVITENGQFELPATVQVSSVYSRIGEAEIIAVPATLGAMLVLAIGWRLWRRRVISTMNKAE